MGNPFLVYVVVERGVLVIRPVRLQLSRRKGFSLQELSRATNGLEAVRCCRPGQFGNRYREGVIVVDLNARGRSYTREQCIELHLRDFQCKTSLLDAVRTKLCGVNLACACALRDLCHCDTLIAFANRGALETPLDECTCGDYRRHHTCGVGPCSMNEPAGIGHCGPDCSAFEMAQPWRRDLYDMVLELANK